MIQNSKVSFSLVGLVVGDAHPKSCPLSVVRCPLQQSPKRQAHGECLEGSGPRVQGPKLEGRISNIPTFPFIASNLKRSAPPTSNRVTLCPMLYARLGRFTFMTKREEIIKDIGKKILNVSGIVH
jgi:hypothetical protein